MSSTIATLIWLAVEERTKEAMIADAEVFFVAVNAFAALGIEVLVKVNHMRVLDGVFAVAELPGEKTRAVSSAAEKLYKVDWEEVRRETMEETGLAESVADEVGRLLRKRGQM